jgi:hypothetical protein
MIQSAKIFLPVVFFMTFLVAHEFVVTSKAVPLCIHRVLGTLLFVPITIRHLTNYGQNAYFWTFWTFSHGGKSRNDTKPISAGRGESKNGKF